VKRLVQVAAVIAVLGYGAVQLVDRGLLELHGDPSTVDGYIKRYIEHGLTIDVVEEGQGDWALHDLRLVGQLFNGGDRALRDVVVLVHVAPRRKEAADSLPVRLGRFGPMRHRWIDQRVSSWAHDDVWFDLEVASVVFENDA
jgi:hypothetical protein